MQKDAVDPLSRGEKPTHLLPGFLERRRATGHNLSVLIGSTAERTNGRKR
jgi:hypothetical protein